MDDGSKHKKAKETKKHVIRQGLMFENYKHCLFNEKTMFKKQQRFKSYYHDMYTEETNKVALSSNDNKGLQRFDRVKAFPQKTPAIKVRENEMQNLHKAKATVKRV